MAAAAALGEEHRTGLVRWSHAGADPLGAASGEGRGNRDQGDDGQDDAQATSHERAAILRNASCTSGRHPCRARADRGLGCTRTDIKQVPNQDLQLQMTEYKVSPLTSYVKPGKLTITAHNDGKLAHNVAVIRQGDVIVGRSTAMNSRASRPRSSSRSTPGPTASSRRSPTTTRSGSTATSSSSRSERERRRQQHFRSLFGHFPTGVAVVTGGGRARPGRDDRQRRLLAVARPAARARLLRQRRRARCRSSARSGASA